MMCAGSETVACGTDAGSPLIFEGKLVGLVSWGFVCGWDFPNVFTQVSHFADFIEENRRG